VAAAHQRRQSFWRPFDLPDAVVALPLDLHAFARYGHEGVLAFSPIPPTSNAPASRLRAHVVRASKSFAAPLPAGHPFLFRFFDPSHPASHDIAARVGRKVAFVGRSMVDNVESPTPSNISVSGRHGRSPARHSRFDPKRLVILASGSKPTDVLSSRIASPSSLRFRRRKRFRHLSARIIPETKKQFSACSITCSAAAPGLLRQLRGTITSPARHQENRNSSCNL